MSNNISIDAHNLISTDKAIKVLSTIVKAQMNGLSPNTPIILHGAPGIGKSTIVSSIAKELNIGFVDIRLSMLERVDLCGLPSVENGQTKWNIPSIWPTDKDSAGIIFLDEITSCSPDLQCAAYSVLCERRIPNTDYTIPEKWTIIAAGNRATDKAIVKTMSSALANRFMHLDLEANAEDWTVWAVTHNIHPSVTGYVRYRPSNLFKMDGQNLESGWPSPRSWEKVSKNIPLFNDDEDVLRKVVYGLVGPGVGLEFMQFFKTANKFDNVLEMLRNPEVTPKLPTKNDERYAFISAVNYLLWAGGNEEEDKVRVEGFLRIAQVTPPDFCAAMTKAALEGNSRVSKLKACSYITKAKGFKEFSKKYNSMFGSQNFSLD